MNALWVEVNALRVSIRSATQSDLKQHGLDNSELARPFGYNSKVLLLSLISRDRKIANVSLRDQQQRGWGPPSPERLLRFYLIGTCCRQLLSVAQSNARGAPCSASRPRRNAHPIKH